MNRRPEFFPSRGAWALVAFAIAGAVGGALLLRATHLPVRGYTVAGIVAGTAALLAIALAGAYSWRKRAGQERTRGPLSAWLAWHLVLSALALLGAWLHSGAHFDGGSGTVATGLLVLALGSGVLGVVRYLRVPKRVLADVGNLAPGTLDLEIRNLRQERDLQLSAPPTEATAREVAAIDAGIAEREARLARQVAYRKSMRGWLWWHVPASLALAGVLAWHVGATWSTAFPTRASSPRAFEPASECKSCHPRQFEEWSGSMHAMAMQSPLTDIQNRLVLALEAEQQLDAPLVGDLCVRCHAPSAYLGDDGHEPIDARVSERKDIGVEGITCTTCHRIAVSAPCESEAQKDGETFRRCEGGADPDQDRQFYNANNLVYHDGRVFHGPYGDEDEIPAVGNAYHRGVASGHAGPSLEQRSSLCASCHTVQVHDPADGTRVLVRLQDTYEEWRTSGEKGRIAWNERFACADCHNARFDRTLDEIARWQDARVCLEERVERVPSVMADEFATLPMRPSAEPIDGFDRPLPGRTKLNHAFVGVDIHLEPGFPEPHYPAFRGVEVPAIEARESTARLLRQAAALRIESFDGRMLRVDVANLATGHTLPAGFAFARELWVEIAVSRSDDGDDFVVVIGGREGEPLEGGQPLVNGQPGLKNFQKVLFDSRSGTEVVLQNQADSVKAGAEAAGLGFQDRVDAIEPGRIRRLDIDLSNIPRLQDVRRVRARLRFRSLPPLFLDRMAALAAERGLDDDADRLMTMKNNLHVFDVAQDTRPLRLDDACPEPRGR